MVARVFNGAQQTQARAAGLADGYKQGQYAVAQAGGLALGQYTGPGRTGVFTSEVKIGTEVGVTPGMGAADALDPQRQNTVWLDAGMLNGFRLGVLDLASGGRIVVSQPLALADGGQLSLVAPVDIDANLTAHGGTVNVSNLFQQAGSKFPVALTAADGSSALTLAPGQRSMRAGCGSTPAPIRMRSRASPISMVATSPSIRRATSCWAKAA